ncbi:helix-turn-helix domain-containing protein [Ramlibacter albus]|uniref:XRE family transcriptional regulator n=1 Tax=Ramlibacter albus TaxID=2079448 RepID=A0A923M7L6_9BURK|nr:helix-turn-helix domain-containing protein [Ramlibacter albus]MBC5765747.1 XRE family transcriptional regulator [Ramlibacter albus]
MGRNVEEIISALPAGRRKRIETQARRIADEMIREADSLAAMRKATGRTQTELAQVLGVTQHAVSQIERRTDLYVSTLQRYVEALGYKLEVTLVTPENRRVPLESFHPWLQPVADTKPRAAPARPGRAGLPRRSERPNRPAASNAKKTGPRGAG